MYIQRDIFTSRSFEDSYLKLFTLFGIPFAFSPSSKLIFIPQVHSSVDLSLPDPKTAESVLIPLVAPYSGFFQVCVFLTKCELFRVRTISRSCSRV